MTKSQKIKDGTQIDLNKSFLKKEEYKRYIKDNLSGLTADQLHEIAELIIKFK